MPARYVCAGRNICVDASRAPRVKQLHAELGFFGVKATEREFRHRILSGYRRLRDFAVITREDLDHIATSIDLGEALSDEINILTHSFVTIENICAAVVVVYDFLIGRRIVKCPCCCHWMLIFACQVTFCTDDTTIPGDAGTC